MLPQMIRGLSQAGSAQARRRSCWAISGLSERLEHRPAELSGGEQQRVAIARAVANAPRILLADEPTGNLDPRTAGHVFGALTQLVRASGLAAIIATHNLELAARMDRRVTLQEGSGGVVRSAVRCGAASRRPELSPFCRRIACLRGVLPSPTSARAGKIAIKCMRYGEMPRAETAAPRS